MAWEYRLVLLHGGGRPRQEKGHVHGFSFLRLFKSINANYLINEAFYQKMFLLEVRTLTGPKSNFVPNGIPIVFKMTDKSANKQTNSFIFI